jgi:hypothetical protein
MARIVYGVSGEGSGHSSRARMMLAHLTLPMMGWFEQEINAHFPAQLGYGINLRNVRPESVGNFLYRLPELTEKLADYPIEGN